MLSVGLLTLITICGSEGFLLGSRNYRQRNVVYYICLNYEAVDATQATECLYCPQAQTMACTGITGPPLQVTRVQATCLQTYCSTGAIGQPAPNGNVIPVSQRRRRNIEHTLKMTTQLDVDSTVLTD